MSGIEATSTIHHGTPAFRRTNLALFAAGFATFRPAVLRAAADAGSSAMTTA
jgi:hypothetical protein